MFNFLFLCGVPLWGGQDLRGYLNRLLVCRGGEGEVVVYLEEKVVFHLQDKMDIS